MNQRVANENDLPETAIWARELAYEPRQSVLAALAVSAGIINDPALLRRLADSLEGKDGRAPQG